MKNTRRSSGEKWTDGCLSDDIRRNERKRTKGTESDAG